MFVCRARLRILTAWLVTVSLASLYSPAVALASPPDPGQDDMTRSSASGSGKQPEPKKGEEREKKQPGTIPLEFTETVESRKVKKGDVVSLKVVDDTAITDQLHFRKDAPASGIIEDVKKPGRFGQRAQIRIRLDWVKDINGVQVPLASYSTGNRFEPGAGGASLGGLVFLGPLGLLGGALIRGGHITIKKGTRIQARVLPREG